MVAEMKQQSSGHRDSSDDNGEAADFSPSLFRKEMLERKYDDDDDDDDDDGAFSQTESEGPDVPNLNHLLLVTTFKIIKIAKILSENQQNCSNQMVTRNQSRGSPILPRVNCCSD